MLIVLVCKVCNRLRKHGDWIKIPEEIKPLMARPNVIHSVCEDCQKTTCK